MSFIVGESLGQAYFDALRWAVEGELLYWYVVVHCSRPIIADPATDGPIDYRDIKGLKNFLNLDEEVFRAFSSFRFHGHDSWSKDCTGRGWIYGRNMSLLDPRGYYHVALSSSFGFNQLDKVAERLAFRDKHGRMVNGGSGNGLVCQVYLPGDDLIRSCAKRPRVNNARCLTQIDFKPIGDRLNLIANFRSQYFDTKAYGNMISLAILLYQMCQRTGYKPGAVVNVAHKVVFHGDKRLLYRHLQRKLG